MTVPDEPPKLDKARHLKYWQRCFKTLLPTGYTSHDSTRMALGFFIVSAFDLLSCTGRGTGSDTRGGGGGVGGGEGAKQQTQQTQTQQLTSEDRKKIREYVLSLQFPGGGFAGSPNHILPRGFYLAGGEEGDLDAEEEEGQEGEEGKNTTTTTTTTTPATTPLSDSESANIASTFFALLLLALVAGEENAEGAFVGVDRRAALLWLRRLQRGDGSFGEVVGGDGGVKGGRDMRYCYLAAGIRWMLRGDVREGDGSWVEDIDVPGLVGHIRQAQTYDGGISETSAHESHAGYAYCAVAALALLERPMAESSEMPKKVLRDGVPDLPALVKFLTHRQFAYIEPPEDDQEELDEVDNFVQLSLAEMSLDENLQYVGYNGRCNKVADTCYCWWVGGTLDLLGHGDLISKPASRRFLMAKTQHIIGGFSKYPGGPPDIYHAFLGLAALAVLGEPLLKELDPALCVSRDTVRKIELGRKALVERCRRRIS